jgi:hypothetical protein
VRRILKLRWQAWCKRLALSLVAVGLVGAAAVLAHWAGARAQSLRPMPLRYEASGNRLDRRDRHGRLFNLIHLKGLSPPLRCGRAEYVPSLDD